MMPRYDEYPTCSVCGDFINDVGGCDTCHGDPYFYDEWYEDDYYSCPNCDSGDIRYVGGDWIVNVGTPEMTRVEFYRCDDCEYFWIV